MPGQRPAQHREREDHPAVLRLFVVAAEQVRDRPDERGQVRIRQGLNLLPMQRDAMSIRQQDSAPSRWPSRAHARRSGRPPVVPVGRRATAAANRTTAATDRELLHKVRRCITMCGVAAVRRVATFRIDDDLREGLDAIWQRDGIQPSEQVRRAIRAWLAEKGIKTKPPARRMTTRRKV
jgi:hypothetical protein